MIPNIQILAPCDANELRLMLDYGYDINRPVIIRYPKDNAFLSQLDGNHPPILDNPFVMVKDGKDILITGSRTLWNDLLTHDLVDEIHLLVGNLILGQGIPVFVGKTPAALRLVDTRRWEDSDNVLLRYEVPHKSA